MSKPGSHLYEFGPFRLDTGGGLLLREGRPVALTPKAYETLVLLVENSGHLVARQELLERVWRDTVVEEGNLTHNIWTLRKALGEDESSQKYIETVPRRGYRFVAPVTDVRSAAAEPIPEPPTSAALAGTHEATRWRRAVVVSAAVAAGLVGLLYFKRPAEKAGAASPGVGSLAVLPFKPMGAQSGGEYIELGMADALITKLSNIRQIHVRPTRAIARYTDPSRDLVSIGRELTVEGVLDGTVQRDGNRVRVTVQLVRVADGKPLWAERFDESWTDIFVLQDRVSEQVARALTLRLSAEEAEKLRRRYTDNAEAYQLYLMGRLLWNKRTAESIAKGIAYFDQAIERDANYALAYAGLAESYVLLPWYGGMPAREAFEKARAAATRALELDETLAEAHTALAYVAERYNWDWSAAEKGYRRALELHPNYPTAHQWYAEYLVQVGRLDAATAEMTRALDLDPLSLIINTEMATVHFHARQYERAIAQARKALEIGPSFVPARLTLARSYMQKGMHQEAHAEFSKALEPDSEDAFVLSLVASNHAVEGDRRAAKKILERLLSRRRPVPAEWIATVYAGLGENDRAFEWLERSCRAREPGLAWIKVHPGLDGLRADPRFAALVRCVGLT